MPNWDDRQAAGKKSGITRTRGGPCSLAIGASVGECEEGLHGLAKGCSSDEPYRMATRPPRQGSLLPPHLERQNGSAQQAHKNEQES